LRFTQKKKTTLLEYGFGERQARAFLKLPCELREECIDYAYIHKMNVAQTEEYIDTLLVQKEKKTTVKDQPAPNIKKGKKKIIIKDLRLFFNSIDHAVGLIQAAGFKIEKVQNEYDDKIELCIVIGK